MFEDTSGLHDPYEGKKPPILTIRRNQIFTSIISENVQQPKDGIQAVLIVQMELLKMYKVKTPYTKGYDTGYIECFSGSASNNTLVKNLTDYASGPVTLAKEDVSFDESGIANDTSLDVFMLLATKDFF